MTTPIEPSLVFVFTPKMHQEDMLKEMHNKVHSCTLSSKVTMKAIICVTMTYEVICSTARAVAATHHVPYVPHTMIEYGALIDRAAYATYEAAVATALGAGTAPPAATTFSEPLADAHDQLQNAFNSHIAGLRWDVVHTGAGAGALNTAQALKAAGNLATLMQDCNTHLANSICAALSTPEMATFHYLTQLDFVKDASGCKTNFGRIPHADVRFPHLQLFPKLAAELFKVGRLLGSSNNTYAIFTSPDIPLGLVHYAQQVDNWFDTVSAYNFASTADFLDWLKAGTRVAFFQKASQSSDMPRALKEQYLKCYQAICASMVLDPTPMTQARVAVFEASFRTDCASAQIASTFDAKKSLRALNINKPATDIDQLLATNLKILEVGKLLQSHSKINALRQAPGVRAPTRGGARGGVRGAALSTRADPGEQSCLWCAKKGHNIFDCPSPPTPALKKVRDDILAKRAAKGRNDNRKARRLASAATSAIVSDDESDEGDELALIEGSYEALQTLFETDEPTKRSCLRVVSDSVASSLAVERRVSIAADSHIRLVPSRCLLPAFVAIAKDLRRQRSFNKQHRSSLLDAMALEFDFCRRSGNTPENQLARLLQLEAYYAYEDYYEHALRDASVLTIRALKAPTRAAVLDTGATCSASNDPAEITALLPSTVLLKPAVGTPQYMRQVRLSIPTFDNTGAPFLFQVPGQAVALPGLSSTLDTLISIGRLFEAGFQLAFRLPKDAVSDDVDIALFPRYGGTIVTPCSRTIHMIYDNYTWTLPVQPHCVSVRPFQEILRQPSSQAARHTDEVLQRRFELDKLRHQQATNLHNSFGHPHNAALLKFVQHTGFECRYLKRYILAHQCSFCDANMGRRSNIVSHTPDKVLPLPALPPPLTTYPNCSFTALCECSACVQSKDRMGLCQRRPGCKCTTCMAYYNKDGTWNEAWASWSVSKPFWSPHPDKQWQPLLPSIDPHDLDTSPIGFIQALRRAVSSNSNLRAATADDSDLQFTQLPPSDVLFTEELADTLRTSEAGTDLRIDWADAASLGFDGEQYFLVVVDKGTEHVVTFNTKTRSDPVDLLADYITITKRVPKYLRVDGAKEFVGAKMKAFCHRHNITLQIVTSYSHTMQARVEGAIGNIKQHSRIALSTANVPTRFWPYATTDFVYKRNFLWCSPDRNGLLSTPQARLQSTFAGTMSTVAHPFGSRIIARLPKLHSQVIGKSFGNRYAEGIYLCSDAKTPAVHMYDMMSRKIMIVSDFIVYPDQFPFRSQTCLIHPSYTAAEIAKMHTQDIADDAAVSAAQQTQAFTRSQTRALEAAQMSPSQQFSPAAIITPDPTIYTPILPSSTALEIASALPASLPILTPEIPVKRILANTPGGFPTLNSKLDDLTEYDIARTMARHGFTFALPLDYNPPTLPTPLGEMIVTVKSAVKLGKKPDAKSAVWVQFLAPPSHAGFKMQLYPRSHESSRGVGQGHDFSILSALARTCPRAATFHDLGITELTSSKVTAAMLLAFSALPRLPAFTASVLDDTESLTNDHGAARSPNEPDAFPPLDDDADTSAPDGYTRYTPDPSHRGEAMRQRLRTHWLAAEELEMAGLIKRKVWERVLRSTLLPSDTIFQTRFHYKIKRKGGKFDKCKVRLVVRGDRMTKKDDSGVGDFEDAFSSVPHASGLRLLLAIATQHNMHTDHVDISQAFTQGELLPGDGQNGKVYISAPPGYPEDPAYCYLLKRPLYGMPSAARAWFTTMSEFLQNEGCSKVGYEESMWQVTQNGHNIVLAAHIDDFVIACADRPTLDSFRSRLLEVFDGTYEGEIRTYLGCEITRDLDNGITILSQKHYAEEILRTYGSWDVTPSSTILPPGKRLEMGDTIIVPDKIFHLRYRGIVGSLGYLVNMTRPDLAFAYSELSKYVQCPQPHHMLAAQYVLRYLRGTYELGIRYHRNAFNPDQLWGWVDADWAGDLETRRSHTGYVLMLNGGPISWKSRRQDSVALSTSEAEYMAASLCGQEVVYIRAILRDFGVQQTQPTLIYEDNLACIAMSVNPVRRKHSRHIDIRRHYIRELCLGNLVKLVPLRTNLMVADALTKSLPAPGLARHRSVMMGHSDFQVRLLRAFRVG